MPIYLLSIYKIPRTICKKLESMRAAFFWRGKGPDERVIHPIAWRNVCRLKDKRGAGLIPIEIINNALLLKWLWKLDMDEGTLWNTIVRHTYLQERRACVQR